MPALTPNGEGSGARGVAGGAEPSDGSAGAGGSGGRGGFARGGTNAGAGGANTDQDDARRNRFAERMQNLSPEEREAMLARMRARGFDPGASGGDFSGRGGAPAAGGAGGSGRGGQQTAENQPPRSGRRASIQTPTAGAAAKESGPTTIDALFAPLPRTETVGRAWIYTGSQLRPIRLRLGISDGQNTELIEGDLKEGAEVVTNVTIAGQTTRPATTAFPGFGPGGRGGFGGGRGAGFGR